MPSPLRPSPAPTDGRDLVLVLDAPGAYVETLMKTSFSALTEKIILPGDREQLTDRESKWTMLRRKVVADAPRLPGRIASTCLPEKSSMFDAS